VHARVQEAELTDRENVLEEGLAAFQKCAEIRAIVLGPTHEQTKLARELLVKFSAKKIATKPKKGKGGK
jgi:hypothetical protein